MLPALLVDPVLLALAVPCTFAQEPIQFAPLRLGFPPDATAEPGGGVRDVALVDWDGDGDLDALQANRWSQVHGGLGLLANDGHARFTVHQAVDLPGLEVVAGDLNGDGAADGWARLSGGGTLLVLNDRSGGFTLSPLAVYADQLELADLDGDGDLDGVFSGDAPTSAGVLWLPNRGDATFDPPLLLGVRAAGSRFGIADLEGDGDSDVPLFVDTGLALLFNDGSGGFADRLVLTTHGAVTFPTGPLAAGDVDGNGTIDLLYADPVMWPQPARLLLCLGGRNYQDASANLPAVSAFTLTLADVDGDGDLDLLTGDRLLRNVGGAVFQDAGAAFPPGLSASSISPADLDRDGDVDLVLGDRNLLLLGDGTGAFLVAGPEAVLSGPGALGDLDGDGDLDALASDESAGGQFSTFRNDGRGALLAEAGSMAPELEPHPGIAPRVGDLDADGDLDFYAGRVGLNDGSGRFSPAPCLVPTGDIRDAPLGDLDGDGDLDAYLARARYIFCHFGPCYVAEPDGLLLNDGTGCFLDASYQVPLQYDVATSAALGDMDADGDLDVVTSALRALRNDGAGFFSDVSPSPFFGIRTVVRDVAIGDVDGNGAPDVYLAGDVDTLLENDGTGRLPVRIVLPSSGWYAALGDLDGDGDLDVAETTLRDDLPSLLVALRNDGASFAVLPQPTYAASGRPVLGDLDRDGDLDVLDGTRALYNLRRSLSNRGVPRIGQPLGLELHGSPLSAWALVASTALAPRTTALGLRQIDLARRIYQRQGTLDAAGRDERSFSVPRNAALLGATLHWQALIGTPLRWSNLETTTLVGF